MALEAPRQLRGFGAAAYAPPLSVEQKKMAVCGLFTASNVNNFVEFTLRATDFVYGEVYHYPSPSTRNLRDRLNPLELYSDEEFRSRYCFSKQSVVLILNELRLNKTDDKRGEPLPPVLKLLVALRFYATGVMQTVVGDLVNVSQPPVSRSIWEMTQAICARLFRKYVRMPTTGEVKSVKTRFFNIAGFPGVTGCIDCTHVQIISPGGDNAELYRNRKGVFSINVQVSCGHLIFYLFSRNTSLIDARALLRVSDMSR